MPPTPGIIHITHQPAPSLTLPAFHDWYNTQHAPARLTLPFIPRGARYRANDSKSPDWLALYEVTDVTQLESPAYTEMAREQAATPTEREMRTKVESERVVYELVSSKGDGPVGGGAAGFLVALRRVFREGVEGAEEEYARWFEEEHVGLVAGIPGWLRSRTFKMYGGKGAGKVLYLTLHEYDYLEEMKATMGRTKGFWTEWKGRVDGLVEEKVLREWRFEKEFEA